jgi:hypothetical protein
MAVQIVGGRKMRGQRGAGFMSGAGDVKEGLATADELGFDSIDFPRGDESAVKPQVNIAQISRKAHQDPLHVCITG